MYNLIIYVSGANQPTCANLETIIQDHLDADPMDGVRGGIFLRLSPPPVGLFLRLSPLTPSIGSASNGPDW